MPDIRIWRNRMFLPPDGATPQYVASLAHGYDYKTLHFIHGKQDGWHHLRLVAWNAGGSRAVYENDQVTSAFALEVASILGPMWLRETTDVLSPTEPIKETLPTTPRQSARPTEPSVDLTRLKDRYCQLRFRPLDPDHTIHLTVYENGQSESVYDGPGTLEMTEAWAKAIHLKINPKEPYFWHGVAGQK